MGKRNIPEAGPGAAHKFSPFGSMGPVHFGDDVFDVVPPEVAPPFASGEDGRPRISGILEKVFAETFRLLREPPLSVIATSEIYDSTEQLLSRLTLAASEDAGTVVFVENTGLDFEEGVTAVRFWSAGTAAKIFAQLQRELCPDGGRFTFELTAEAMKRLERQLQKA